MAGKEDARMIYPGSAYELKVFQYWLDKRVYAKRNLSATAFLRMCRDRKVPGLEPGSDTGLDGLASGGGNQPGREVEGRNWGQGDTVG